MSIGQDAAVGDIDVALLLEAPVLLEVPEHSASSASCAGGSGGVDAGRTEPLRAASLSRSRGLACYLWEIHLLGCVDGAGRDEFSADEVGHVLGWSRSMAAGWLQLADDVIVRLPVLLRALLDGRLDETKVRALAEWTRGMPLDLARRVVAELLGGAARQTTSALIDDIGSVAAALDADWARRREQAAAARARVVAVRTPAGTADVCLRDIAPADAVELMARLDRLACAVRAAGRAAGLDPGIGVVRALVSLRQQDGSYVGCSDEALLDGLIAELPAWIAATTPDDPDTDAPDADGGPDDGGPDNGGPDDGGPDDGGPDDGGPDDGGPDDGGPDDGGPDDGGPSEGPDDGGPDGGPDYGGPDGGGPDYGGPDDRGPDDGGPDDSGPDDSGPDGGGDDDSGRDPSEAVPEDAVPEDAGDAEPGDDPFAATRRGVRAGTAEVRLRLSTALGLDDLPGRIPTWGSVTAHTGRDLLRRARKSDTPVEWRLVLVDPDGHLEHVLLIRPDAATPSDDQRPQRDRHTGPRTKSRGRIRGHLIVELAAATAMLAALDPDDHPEWARFIRRARTRLRSLTPEQLAGGTAHPASTTAHAHRRRPGRELDRWIRIRDRHCLGVLCTRAAHGNDLDHTRDWVCGGLTLACNLGGLCRHCHRLKHEGRWHLTQPEPGRFTWRSRAGATYTVGPRPILEHLPVPYPPADGRPRPVLDVDPPPPPEHPGWIDDDHDHDPGHAERPTPTARPHTTSARPHTTSAATARATTSAATASATTDDDPPPF